MDLHWNSHRCCQNLLEFEQARVVLGNDSDSGCTAGPVCHFFSNSDDEKFYGLGAFASRHIRFWRHVWMH